MSARLDDMRVFAKLAEMGSLSAAARALGMPKQTLSRRLAALEQALGVTLATRSTRRLRLTDAGTAYAGRCAEIVRLADEANLAVTDRSQAPTGTLRLTADPTFGEAFLPALVAEFVESFPAVSVEAVLTSRRVDLIEEGFDVAFRVGRMDDSSLVARKLGAARLCYAASLFGTVIAIAGALVPGLVLIHGTGRGPEPRARAHLVRSDRAPTRK